MIQYLKFEKRKLVVSMKRFCRIKFDKRDYPYLTDGPTSFFHDLKSLPGFELLPDKIEEFQQSIETISQTEECLTQKLSSLTVTDYEQSREMFRNIF